MTSKTLDLEGSPIQVKGVFLQAHPKADCKVIAYLPVDHTGDITNETNGQNGHQGAESQRLVFELEELQQSGYETPKELDLAKMETIDFWVVVEHGEVGLVAVEDH